MFFYVILDTRYLSVCIFSLVYILIWLLHFQMRAKKSIWPQIEATFKQMDIAATELECFKALQNQEQLAASHRINNLWSEVQKQKELEKTLQNRYGSLIEELEKMQNIMNQCRLKAEQQKEIEANNAHAETNETKINETDVQDTGSIVPHSAEDGNAQAITVESSHDGTSDQQVEIMQDKSTSSPSHDMNVDSDNMHTVHDSDAKLANASPAAENVVEKVEGSSPTDGYTDNGENVSEMGASMEINSPNQDVVANAVTTRESSVEETNAVTEETN